MKREEIIKKLHAIGCGVELTIMSSEGAIECSYITPKGYGYEWRSIDDWPLVRLSRISRDLIKKIKEKSTSKSLSYDDILGTEFALLYDEYNEENKINIINFFKNILLIDDSCNVDNLYVIVNDNCPYFYVDYKQFEKKFYETIALCDTEWEELSDEELIEAVEKCEEGLNIPMRTYSDLD